MNCVDSITKFVTAHLLVDKRKKANCIKFLSQIKERCYSQILAGYYTKKFLKIDKRFIFIYDGFENYKSAFNKLFYRVAKLQFGVPIACKKFELKHNNNQVERYNGKIKDGLNCMRGEFKSFEYAEAFMNLQHIMNNFVNPHQQLGEKTPAEKAEIKLKLGRNRLLGLIRFVRDNYITRS